MIVFKPRLAAFYVVLFATIALLSSRVTVKTHANLSASQNPTIGEALH